MHLTCTCEGGLKESGLVSYISCTYTYNTFGNMYVCMLHAYVCCMYICMLHACMLHVCMLCVCMLHVYACCVCMLHVCTRTYVHEMHGPDIYTNFKPYYVYVYLKMFSI